MDSDSGTSLLGGHPNEDYLLFTTITTIILFTTTYFIIIYYLFLFFILVLFTLILYCIIEGANSHTFHHDYTLYDYMWQINLKLDVRTLLRVESKNVPTS